eukprot:1961058-Amphidinium_carterae.1
MPPSTTWGSSATLRVGSAPAVSPSKMFSHTQTHKHAWLGNKSSKRLGKSSHLEIGAFNAVARSLVPNAFVEGFAICTGEELACLDWQEASPRTEVNGKEQAFEIATLSLLRAFPPNGYPVSSVLKLMSHF